MPGRTICFVCGSPGADLSLRIKAHERAPYFPFLEHHDPPKGSRLPGTDGIVDSCRVCFAFLTQQWETYERSKTPAIKRLYWLKRADNGHFTGAEMRLQGEYIAQIMGLQYQPGLDGPNSPDTSTRDGVSPIQYRKDDRVTPDVPHRSFSSIHSADERHTMHSDTKMAIKSTSNNNVSAIKIPKMSQSPKGIAQNVMQHHPRASHGDGVLDLTIKKEERSTPTGTPQSNIHEMSFACYICVKVSDAKNCKCINSCLQPTSEPFFPVLQKIPRPPEAIEMNYLGQVLVCSDCKTSLYQQWQAYELSGVRLQDRVYKLYGETAAYSNLSMSVERRMSESNVSSEYEKYVCYLCGKSYHEDLIRMLYTVAPREPNMATLFFPFVRELRRPHGAQPLKADGTVMSCRNCYAELYQQWQIQEAQQIPVLHRKYSLSFLSQDGQSQARHPEVQSTLSIDVKHTPADSVSQASASDLRSPLNIQISEADPVVGSNSGSSNQSSQGLLAIATSSDKQVGL